MGFMDSARWSKNRPMSNRPMSNRATTNRRNDEVVAVAVRQFLKTINATAQREIEKAVRTAIASGKLQGNETCTAGVTLTSEKAGLNVTIYSKIEL